MSLRKIGGGGVMMVQGPRGRPATRLVVSSVLAGLATGVLASTTRAETLADALALAYQSNPTLQQARAQQRALDETYVQARTGWDPTASITATDNYERVFDVPGSPSVNTGGATLNVAQPLYTGGRTAAAVRAAEAAVLAGREGLRATEATVLQSVVQSYEDVLRDQTLLAVREDDVRSLSRVQDEIQARRDVGQISRTDVAQIQAQLATAQANLAAAQAQLQNSRAEYTAAVGQNPGTLVVPPPLPQLPANVDAAFDAAESESPLLRQAVLTEQSSRSRIEEARAAYRPTVAAGASLGYLGSTEPAQVIDYDKAFTAQVTVTQPLFTGGLTGSGVRQALENNTADRVGVERTRRQVVQTLSQAWNQLISSSRMRAADQAALNAAQVELTGMQAEYRIALRTTLEVVSADETVRSAQISLAEAEHDDYVAQANVLAAIGRLEVRYLTREVPHYDPARNLRKVEHKGATPYEPVIAAVDSLGMPRVSAVRPVPAPLPPATPVALIPGREPSAGLPLATAVPVTPEPETVSPRTPAALGAQPGAVPSGPIPEAEDEIQKLLDRVSPTHP